ncbi:chorismate mutase [Mycobacterium haemophilum DSM 44634]|uniref:chorismate mutase n=1 Tax=Mycobacterium haemophilum TaxID=29311 RepID=UPI0006D5BF3B|nr:chorismate mutase [Mycobacterium haemophilum]MCV7340473.1 chorismate mutase [Mycobacterium haemophilum DSM 44634]
MLVNSTRNHVCRGRRGAVRATSPGVLGALAVLVAALIAGPPPARADGSNPLIELIDAAAQRLVVAEPVAAFKWIGHGDIEDPGRVQQVLAKMRAEASAKGVDPDYVARVFGDQINATEAIEYSRFADWKFNPSGAPTASPELSASRSSIDAFNETMLTQMTLNWDLLHSPACAVQLDAARSDVVRDRQLDGLYQQALSLATQSYC